MCRLERGNYIPAKQKVGCNSAVDSARRGSALAPKKGKQPEKKREAGAQNEARDDREIESGVFPVVDDVPRKPPQSKWKFAAKIKKCTDNRDKAPEDEEPPAEFAGWIHK